MKVVIFTLCQHASVDNGALTVSNAFSNLLLPHLPFKARFEVAIRLFFTGSEQGNFQGVVRLFDPDSQEVARWQIKFDVSISDLDVTGVFADSVGVLIFTFKTAGEFQFHLEDPSGSIFQIPLYVNLKSVS